MDTDFAEAFRNLKLQLEEERIKREEAEKQKQEVFRNLQLQLEEERIKREEAEKQLEKLRKISFKKTKTTATVGKARSMLIQRVT